jgi:hypothetical protein
MGMVAQLTQEVMYLKKENACMQEEIVSLRSLLVASPRVSPQCIPMEQIILPTAASPTGDAYPQSYQQVPLTVPSTKVNLVYALPAAVAWTQLIYKDVAATGILLRGSSSLPVNEGFQTVTCKRVTTARSLPAVRTKKRRRRTAPWWSQHSILACRFQNWQF